MEDNVALSRSHLEKRHTSYLVLLLLRPLKRREPMVQLSSLLGSVSDRLPGSSLTVCVKSDRVCERTTRANSERPCTLPGSRLVPSGIQLGGFAFCLLDLVLFLFGEH